jgi:hypothetical protein
MNIRHILVMYAAIVAVACLMSMPASAAVAASLKIDHSPVTIAVRGQDVLFRVRVVPGAQPVKAVTLFYSVSRDAAPYKLAMQASGVGWFTGSISADMTAGLNQILYYIEARDTSDVTAETPWHTIAVKNPGSGVVPPATTAPATVNQKPPAQEESSWTKPALIAGGVILAGGAALALASGGGGGGGSSSDSPTNAAAGTYGGTVTICEQPPGSGSVCSSHAMTVLIDNTGMVSSDALYEGKHLEGKLSGSNFLLSTPVSGTNGTGEIQFLGTVVDNRIAGSVQGSFTSASGVGTYSGNFNGIK